jgi:hypothetical protein
VQFDPIRSDASLPVKEVEEGDASDTRPAADLGEWPGAGHLLSSVGHRSLRADCRGSLRDHRARAAAQDEVVVEVGLGAVEGDAGDDRIDPAFRQESPTRRKVGRTGETRQVFDGGRSCRQEKRPVLQRLDRPTLDAATSAAEKRTWCWWAGAATRAATAASQARSCVSRYRRPRWSAQGRAPQPVRARTESGASCLPSPVFVRQSQVTVCRPRALVTKRSRARRSSRSHRVAAKVGRWPSPMASRFAWQAEANRIGANAAKTRQGVPGLVQRFSLI